MSSNPLARPNMLALSVRAALYGGGYLALLDYMLLRPTRG